MTRTLSPTVDIDTIHCPAGFSAAGGRCGIKASGNDDLAIILCPGGATAAAMFTRNRVKAAPVVISREKLDRTGGRVRALLINSGCANAATGEEGIKRARRIMDAVASHLGCSTDEVLMNSTGVIGEQLPDQQIIGALPGVLSSAASDGLVSAARAIMTTDTMLKVTEHIVRDGECTCRVVGIAKGSGMIHPDMATTIGVILTDAAVDSPRLDVLLRDAVEQSFHRISVDGDTSTNDSVFVLASGEAGPISEAALSPALTAVARDLATMVVRDGEGASKLIRVVVSRAATADVALQVARTVAGSLLVRTSVTGGDPNWGRLLMAVGRSGVEFDPDTIALSVNDLPIYRNGAAADTPLAQLEAAYGADVVTLGIDLAQGNASDEFLTCDLTEHYVRINADYRT